MYKTIRKNATKKIAALLAACPMIRKYRYDDMGDDTGIVQAEEVMEAGALYEFDRVYEDGDCVRLIIHRNFTFTAYKSLDAARRNLTPEAQRKYGLI